MRPKLIFILIIFILIVLSIYLLIDPNDNLFGNTISISFIKLKRVKNTKELFYALQNAKPGDVIYLDDGIYYGPIDIKVNGTSKNRITLEGSKDAIINSIDLCIRLFANYWTLKGFSVSNCSKGIFLENANFNILDGLNVYFIEDEAIHILKNSSDNIVKNCRISFTGLKNPGFGEGVYIGQANKFWKNQVPDYSNRNKVIKNYFGPNVSAESIDIKEGTGHGLIDGNIFDGTGMVGANYATSWINIKGHYYVVVNNKGKYSLGPGIKVGAIPLGGPMSACLNTVENNTCSNISPKDDCVFTYIFCKNFIRNNIIV